MRKVIKLFGTEEEIEELLREINPYLPPYTIQSDCFDARVEFDDIDEETFMDLMEGLDAYVYGEGEDTLEESFVRFAIANGITVATAESCTGGLIASSIVNVSGASKIFHEGLVTYSNAAKIDRLGVSEETIEAYGAVSEETAMEMAEGLISENVDFGVSTTGIAGPTGGTPEKPVGLVYIGTAYKGFPPTAYKFIFEGDRSEVRTSARNAALFKAWKYLENIL